MAGFLDKEGFAHVWNNILERLNLRVPTSRTINGKPLSGDIVLTAEDIGADASGSSGTTLEEAKRYTDAEIAALVNSAPETMDTLGELATLLAENEDAVDMLNDAIGSRALNSDLTAHTDNGTIHVTPDDKSKWNKNVEDVASIVNGTTTVPNATSATKATSDASGNVINTTYATKNELEAVRGSLEADTNTTYTLTKSGSTITLTGSDGSTTSVTDADTDTNTWRPLGTTADTACAGNDSRLSNARPASDVYSWAKASSKPSYTKAEVGLGNVDNTADSAKSVAYAASAGSASSATGANYSNQLQAFTADNFTGGDHFVKAIRGSGWNTHLWMCYNGGAAQSDAVSVNYANNAGSAASATTAGTCTGNSATASKLYNHAGYAMSFNWSGQSGQPTWLWGGEDGSNMYVYNPANFSVSYAASAGSAPANGGTASYATYAANSTAGSYTLKNIAAGTTDLVAGSTGLSTGHIYIVYE